MNPSGKNEVFEEDIITNVGRLNPDDFRRYTIIATSTPNLAVAAQWDAFSKKINVPYYNLVCCGLHGFVFISLGAEYTFKEINKKDNRISKIWQVKSLPLGQALQWTNVGKYK